MQLHHKSTNGPVNAHLRSGMHMYEYYHTRHVYSPIARAGQTLGPIFFFKIINLQSLNLPISCNTFFPSNYTLKAYPLNIYMQLHNTQASFIEVYSGKIFEGFLPQIDRVTIFVI